MKIFDHPNLYNFTCPICHTQDDKPVTLVGIDGTEHDGIMEAKQVHVDCLDLRLKHLDGQILIYLLTNSDEY